jgi:hypothetical protein
MTTILLRKGKPLLSKTKLPHHTYNYKLNEINIMAATFHLAGMSDPDKFSISLELLDIFCTTVTFGLM